jgi:hypothetical protein
MKTKTNVSFFAATYCNMPPDRELEEGDYVLVSGFFLGTSRLVFNNVNNQLIATKISRYDPELLEDMNEEKTN